MEQKVKTMVAKPALSGQLHEAETSALARYRGKVLGDTGLIPFLIHELSTMFFGGLGGGIGYLLRKWSYSRLFRKVGNGLILGKGIILRHPGRISVGRRVAVDDYAMLDAGGSEQGIVLGDDIIISRNCVIQAKSGPVVLGARTDIGCNTILSSVSGIHVGRSVLMAGNCYLGGARYVWDRLDIPMMDQGRYSEGPVLIGDDVWLGAGVIVPDGRRIGNGCVVGAGSVVTRDLPDYAVAAGAPARIIRMRGEPKGSGSEVES